MVKELLIHTTHWGRLRSLLKTRDGEILRIHGFIMVRNNRNLRREWAIDLMRECLLLFSKTLVKELLLLVGKRLLGEAVRKLGKLKRVLIRLVVLHVGNNLPLFCERFEFQITISLRIPFFCPSMNTIVMRLNVNSLAILVISGVRLSIKKWELPTIFFRRKQLALLRWKIDHLFI